MTITIEPKELRDIIAMLSIKSSTEEVRQSFLRALKSLKCEYLDPATPPATPDDSSVKEL